MSKVIQSTRSVRCRGAWHRNHNVSSTVRPRALQMGQQPGYRAVALSEHEAACGVLWLERPVCARRY
ncbi:hypothetical protein RER_28690 [Rhodococcus erythropolis PR4]|uniref:Uncharacterized protein n=1 Tax=Rhodococcus erythropolis (strain PR4 / NBRC 100887) TaxID=234621 RepID=C0ZYZ2_RHOE4|nr:hypothetical protein RER_28690 [Rhodococcus erythropolis PR4]